jgi:hypothetical protein
MKASSQHQYSSSADADNVALRTQHCRRRGSRSQFGHLICVQGRRSRRRGRAALIARRQGEGLSRGAPKGPAKTHRKRPARPQLPHPPARPRQPDPQQRPLRRRIPHNNSRQANPIPDPRLRTPQPHDRPVGRTRSNHRVRSMTSAQEARKSGLV